MVHKNKLEQFCRLCGDSTAALPGRTPTGKDLFPKEIQDIYFIDVNQDNEYIHPPYICFSKCKSKLLQYQRQKKRQQHHLAGGSSSRRLPKDRAAVAWKSHGSDDKYRSCNVCQSRRSPRKKVILDHDHCYFVGASKKLAFDSDTGQNSSSSTSISDKAKNIEAEAVLGTSTTYFEPPAATSVPTERFKNPAVAKIFSCAICLGVPTEQPVLSPCQHMYCESCMGHWLKFINVCCVCKQLTEMEDLVPLKMHLKELHVPLEVHCEN